LGIQPKPVPVQQRTLHITGVSSLQSASAPDAKVAPLPAPASGRGAPPLTGAIATKTAGTRAHDERSSVKEDTSHSEARSNIHKDVVEEGSDRRARPLRALLDLGAAKGLGEWRILVSGRAARNLRVTASREPRTFKIILKKIKYDLSTFCVLEDGLHYFTGSFLMVISLPTTKSN
jgi:hypothetical protein